MAARNFSGSARRRRVVFVHVEALLHVEVQAGAQTFANGPRKAHLEFSFISGPTRLGAAVVRARVVMVGGRGLLPCDACTGKTVSLAQAASMPMALSWPRANGAGCPAGRVRARRAHALLGRAPTAARLRARGSLRLRPAGSRVVLLCHGGVAGVRPRREAAGELPESCRTRRLLRCSSRGRLAPTTRPTTRAYSPPTRPRALPDLRARGLPHFGRPSRGPGRARRRPCGRRRWPRRASDGRKGAKINCARRSGRRPAYVARRRARER